MYEYIIEKSKKDNMNKFKLHSNFKPKGDQSKAIEYLSDGIKNGKRFQTLLRCNRFSAKHILLQML